MSLLSELLLLLSLAFFVVVIIIDYYVSAYTFAVVVAAAAAAACTRIVIDVAVAVDIAIIVPYRGIDSIRFIFVSRILRPSL